MAAQITDYDNKPTQEFYDQLWGSFPLELQGVMAHLHRVFPEGVAGKTVLDAGFGSGLVSIGFAKLGAKVTGVDLGHENVKNAQRRAIEHNVEIEFLQGDLKTFDLGREFDIVYSWGVIMMTGDAKASFDRLVAHTQPDGRLLVAVYLKTWLSPFWNFTRDVYRLFPRFMQLGFSYTGAGFIYLYDLIRFGLMRADMKELRGSSRVSLMDDWFGPPYRSFHSIEEVSGWYREHGMTPRLLEAQHARFKSTTNFEIIGHWENPPR